MEYEVKLTHIFKAFIQCFDKDLNQVKDAQLTFWRVDTEHKVECGVVAVDELVVCSSNEAGRERILGQVR